ncbi:unnamed protein product [Adineta steineri]|uniref:Uncharacterized protein n=1 Tax=Adineta steineri TaxID=433720 RepID=A0A818VYV6_9BILA|nr:unnamed protein product [Adineta steineri]CAF3717416.1 unnamed protein product [Adineta steineri]
MENCSYQCIRRTLYAVLIGVSPIVLCLLLIALARLILHQLETAYHRRQKFSDRRRSSSAYHPTGRPTLLYTPVSTTELQRIIQGKKYIEPSPILAKSENSSPKASKFMKSILTRREPSPSRTLSSLVIRRHAINSTPMTALFAPTSTPLIPTFNIINETMSKSSNAITVKHESSETKTLSTINNKRINVVFHTNDSFDAEQTDIDPFLFSSSSPTTTTTTTTTTVGVEEFLDFHSVRSVPYALSLVN